MNFIKLMVRRGRWVALIVVMGLAISASAQQQQQSAVDISAKHIASLPADLSKAVVETTMRTHPNAAELGKWGYAQALYLYGEYLVYERTHDPRYLAYIKSWADANIDAQGKINRKIIALDYMLPGNLMLILYHETGEAKYKAAATEIWDTLTTDYPRTKDGGFWHATVRQHQLWLDGTYMALPFMVHYGEAFGKEKYAYDEASKQLLIYASHLNDPKSGLLFHAYDESGAQKWADPVTHHSSIFWARSIGWYGMALIDVLEKMPADHPNRPKLIALVRQLVHAYARYQDPKTGLWYNVVNMPKEPGNWLETSASSMYVYTISKAVERGYVSKKYEKVACKGYRGVLSELSPNADGGVDIANICIGTNVGNLQFYLDRPRKTNDDHGLGAFLIMNEQMRNAPCVVKMRAKASRAK
ncbi:MAG TPA: glycoside hydrolase family 88 protein [Edaphobacter sp.]|nr:glycoside hydrolase family 88 protein [Edaphobacter sp.]